MASAQDRDGKPGLALKQNEQIDEVLRGDLGIQR